MTGRVCSPSKSWMKYATNLMQKVGIQPSLDQVREVISSAINLPNPPNLVPICASISSEFLTPSSIYLKISAKSVTHHIIRTKHMYSNHIQLAFKALFSV